MRTSPLHPALHAALFLAGLAAVAWVGAGYLAFHPAGVAVLLVIAACYIAGAIELYRYRQATTSLAAALSDLPADGGVLDPWLERLHPHLRHPVRLRIEGERAALPAPALTPYLVGLLVLLGMLGTLLGMMATLSGTGLALENAGDLQAIRGTLAAPVKGLAFAFGTSIAGVATSAALGLLSALARRERLQVVQRLDAAIATSLRAYSLAWRRDEALRVQQRQAELLPVLVERLQAMVAAIERQNAATGEQLLAGQQDFHARAEASQARLAATLEQSLRSGVAESARAIGDALQPAVAATLAGLAREANTLHDTLSVAMRQQLEDMSAGLAGATGAAAHAWQAAAVAQQDANASLLRELHDGLDRHAAALEQRANAVVDGIAARLEANAEVVASAWRSALAQQDERHAEQAARNEQALATAAAAFERHATAMVGNVDRSHGELQALLAAQEQQRLAAWAEQVARMGAGLRQDWEQAGQAVAARQQAICDALAASANDMAAQAQAHASATIAEIERLVDAAAQAPRAAAEVIAELRQKLSESMVRDTAMLEERTQLIGTLGTLLDAVNHASTEQRGAIDALVATSADLLERVGTRFTDHIEAETGKLGDIAAQVAVGATEVASLGDAFGAAVQVFGQSNEELLARLQGIEAALDRSLARSDEQLAYYVAQAREVVDLSLLAQKQIVEDLQRIGGPRQAGNDASAAGTEAA
ncbi:DUF802 domain-containing protein [Pseudoxanthomonas kaohsiungensis]|uniref:DUF802 domain-containing protein n=1 Tax=Pseudoxanthomonas kaohsiungensis TaxID=283923 RepID=UPI0035AF82F6